MLRKRRPRWPKRAQVAFYWVLREEIESLYSVWLSSEPDISKVLQGRKDSQSIRIDSIRDMVGSALARSQTRAYSIHRKLTEISNDIQKTAILAVNEALGKELPIPREALDAARNWSSEVVELSVEVMNTLRRQVMDTVSQAARNNSSPAELRKLVKKLFESAKAKAIQLSDNATGNLFGELVKTIQTSAGIRRYRWNTQADERVRLDHALLHETIQRWDKPPIVHRMSGRRAHPGLDYQCRCFAVPLLPTEAE